MGNTNDKERYIGGKIPSKYFKEDIWLQYEELFERFQINESKGFELFRIFAIMDKDQSETLDMEECFEYIGQAKKHRNRFTERIFYVDDSDKNKKGLSFKEFAISLWSYCTLTPEGLARYLYEIFDIDRTGYVESWDVDAMYRMVYNTDYADSLFVNSYPYLEKLTHRFFISKDEFISFTSRGEMVMIKPALDYQLCIQKKIGGIKLWHSLTNYRTKEFSNVEKQSTTLQEAVDTIMSLETVNQKKRRENAESLLELQREKLRQEKARAALELRLHQEKVELERLEAELRAEDRPMKLAWNNFEECKHHLEVDEFTTADIWRRRELRERLYEAYDEAIERSVEYIERKDRNDLDAVEGSDVDHEARYRDYLATLDGKAVFDLIAMIELFVYVMDLLSLLNPRNKKPTIGSSSSSNDGEDFKKSDGEVTAEAYHKDLTRLLDSLFEVGGASDEKEMVKRMQVVRNKKYFEEKKFAMRTCKPSDVVLAEENAHQRLVSMLRDKAIKDFSMQQEREKLRRKRDWDLKEFDIATRFGSRQTRWECVYDPEADQMLRINIDTNQVKTFKTAICEKCDSIIAPEEIKCTICFSHRSPNNLKFYKALGSRTVNNGEENDDDD